MPVRSMRVNPASRSSTFLSSAFQTAWSTAATSTVTVTAALWAATEPTAGAVRGGLLSCRLRGEHAQQSLSLHQTKPGAPQSSDHLKPAPWLAGGEISAAGRQPLPGLAAGAAPIAGAPLRPG